MQLRIVFVVAFLYRLASPAAGQSKIATAEEAEVGTTIITHGLSLLQDDFFTGPYPWMKNMADAIVARAGNGRIFYYDRTTGTFVPDGNFGPSPDEGEWVLLLDWTRESDSNSRGFSEAAAATFFAALIRAENQGLLQIQNLHFIGHSRGTVVNSEIVERLLAIGKPVRHVTNLDAHDWGLECGWRDHDLNPRIEIVPDPAGTQPNNGVISWSGVTWSDSYWQNNSLVGDWDPTDPAAPICTNYGPSTLLEWLAFLGVIENQDYALNGRWIGGTYHESWSDTLEPDGAAMSHSGIREHYTQTIVNPEADHGYAYSRLGGNFAGMPISGIPKGNAGSFSFYDGLSGTSAYFEGVVGGDFERAPGSSLWGDDMVGWGPGHGGGGTGSLEDGHLRLSWGNTWRQTNQLYVPSDAGRIWYRYRTETTSSDDQVVVTIEGRDASSTDQYPVGPVNGSDEWLDKSIDVWQYQGQVVTLRIELEDGPTAAAKEAAVTSQVWIDDVRFEPQPLALKWGDIRAIVSAGWIEVNWTVEGDREAGLFEIERATQGVPYVPVGRVPATRAEWAPTNYSFHDLIDFIHESSVTYRIRHIESDGLAILSPEVEVALPLPETLIHHGAYPNPFGNQTTIAFDLPASTAARLRLFDVLGKEVRTPLVLENRPGRHEVIIQADDLPAGPYVYRITSDGLSIGGMVVVTR